MILSATDIIRFEAKVKRSSDGCDEWQGGLDERGYGRFWVDGKTRRAHRIAWYIAHGEWPAQLVLHECDNPRCVRLSHLFVGTHSDNARDAFVKGRRTPPRNRARGSAHGKARFVEVEVVEIRRLASKGVSQTAIAHRFKTTQPRISEIIRRKTWAHLLEETG